MSREIIQKARDIVANKWFQGYYRDADGGYCVLGALGMASTGKYEQCPRELVDSLAAHLPDVGWSGNEYCNVLCCRSGECTHIPHFNDDPTTTKEMVLQLFDKTLANL